MYNPNEGIGRVGKFLIRNFKGKAMNIFTSNQNEEIHYSQTAQTSWTLLQCTIEDYDEESGVLTIKSLVSNSLFYLNEFKVELFWEEGAKYSELINDTIGRRGAKKSKRDIVK